jgi:hypothetical protein
MLVQSGPRFQESVEIGEVVANAQGADHGGGSHARCRAAAGKFSVDIQRDGRRAGGC